MLKAYQQVKPILPNLPTAVIRIDMEFKPWSFLVWLSGTVQPVNKQVLICLTEGQYDSIIDTVRSGNGATQGLLIEQLVHFSNDPSLTFESCQVIEDLHEVNEATEIAELLVADDVVKGINPDFNFKHSMNVCFTEKTTGQQRWIPVWATDSSQIALNFHSEISASLESQCKWFSEQLLSENSHHIFSPTTISLIQAIKDELTDWSMTDLTYAQAERHENCLRKIFLNHNLPCPL